MCQGLPKRQALREGCCVPSVWLVGQFGAVARYQAQALVIQQLLYARALFVSPIIIYPSRELLCCSVFLLESLPLFWRMSNGLGRRVWRPNHEFFARTTGERTDPAFFRTGFLFQLRFSLWHQILRQAQFPGERFLECPVPHRHLGPSLALVGIGSPHQSTAPCWRRQPDGLERFV